MSLSVSRLALPAWPEIREVTLAEQLLTLRRRWRLIFCAALLMPGLAFAALHRHRHPALRPRRRRAAGRQQHLSRQPG
jgi:hypothetical protein